MQYNWQHPGWPSFTYKEEVLQDLFIQYLMETNQITGAIKNLEPVTTREILIDFMTEEALKTSKIEGEELAIDDVRSSLLNQIGIAPEIKVRDPRSKGVAKLMIDVRASYAVPLSEAMLFKWHNYIMADAYQREIIEVGKWRSDPSPMQIVSGPYGQEKISFEAPPSDKVPMEMFKFIDWFNKTTPKQQHTRTSEGLIRAAIAHLYFESIHPFADSNGRIGRAIAEKAIFQDLNQPAFLSLSCILYQRRKKYYEELSHASKYSLEVTDWVHFFLECIVEALKDAKKIVFFIIEKTKFWRHHEAHLDDKQAKALKRMFDSGPGGFEGGMTAKKYVKITGCSKATATRDLKDLLEKGCLLKGHAEGRGTHYYLNLTY